MSRNGSELDGMQLFNLFEQAPGFVCFLRGPEFVIELANSAFCKLVRHREVLGRTVRDALPETSAQGYLDLLERVFHSREPFMGRMMKYTVQEAPGAPLIDAFVNFIYQPILAPDGQAAGILVQGQDVTELKREETKRQEAEAALRASEERYRTLFESIDDGFCLMQMIDDDRGETVDYRFLETNAAFEGQTGLRAAVGRTARELVPDLDRSWFRIYGDVARTGVPARFENHAPAMGRWFDVYANRVGRPELRQVALVFKDVTERKEVESERQRLLERESVARHEAEEAGRLKDEFLATVSHELRTPLTSMLGWVQMLRSRKLPPEKQDRALETVERNARAQAQLVEDLLDVSRILAGKLRLEVAPVELQAVVDAALETVRPAIEAKGLRVQATLDTTGTVMGDAHRLQQIIWNLLANAVKFTPRGGRIQIVVERRDSAVELTISDTGQGIAPDFLPHVFERFRQARGGTTRSHGGLGLGLSIVRQLVELHGGRAFALSDGEGKGATFIIRLPLAAALRREVAPSPTPRSTAFSTGIPCPTELQGLTVLVVDDEEDTREMLRTLIESHGGQVTLAPSVEEGLKQFRAHPPAILLSDIGMPDQDGYDFIARIRALPPEEGGDVPAVALTAYARTQDRTRALLSGFSTHVPKPVEPLELLAAIASLAGQPRHRGG